MAVRLRDGELVTTLIAVALSLALVFRVWADVRPMLDRLVTVHESRYAKPAASTSEPMPDDLYAQAKTLAGEWAQDDLMASMQEAYAELGDWTKVRARFVGVMG